MFLIQKNKLIVIMICAIIAIALSLQINYSRNNPGEGNIFGGNLSKDIVGGGAKFVDNLDGEGDFFSDAKLEREITYGKNNEVINEALRNVESSIAQKSEAIEQLNKLLSISTIENKIEILAKEKGFNDAYACIASDGSVDLYVKAPSLSNIEVTQLSDIASRQANIPINMIHVRNKY